MKKGTILKLLIVCIFGTVGWYQFGVMKQMESNNLELKAIESNNNMVFLDGAGVDIMGNEIDSVFTDKTEGVRRSRVAFLLRYNSLEVDLEFWNEVGSLLSKLDAVPVRLTAYCENGQCVEAIRKNPDVANFTVLEYGEVVDMQAMLGADAVGEFWLIGSGFKKINWRDGTQRPVDIAISIGMRQ